MQNQYQKYISVPAVVALGTAVLLTAFFELWRGILLVLLESPQPPIPASVWIEAFLVGVRFDFAMASYVALPVYLLAVLPWIGATRNRVSCTILIGFVSIAAALTFFLHLADIEFFRFFNTRLNGMALQWADTPGFMVTMIWQTYPVVRYLLLYGGMLLLFVWLLRRMLRHLSVEGRQSPWWIDLAWLPVVAAILVVGARGRIEEKAPLTWGLAYFSPYDMANQLALNPTFTFLRDAVYDRGSKEETRRVMEAIAFPEADSLVRVTLGMDPISSDSPAARLLRSIWSETEDREPPNIVVVIMESFGSSHIGVLDNLVPYDLTPEFDSLSRDGLLFTNIYSAGSHTYAGILGTLYGYPTIYGKSIMKQIAGQNRFVGLPNLLRDRGYETLFFTTHDPQFDNMQGFLMANGVQRVYSLFDYDQSQKVSTLGVPDHVMFDRALVELKARQGKRWFASLLTATNHGPWVVPDVPFGPLPDSVPDRDRLNAFKYSDWALGRFLRQMAEDPNLRNTLVVVTADNGMLYHPQVDLDPTQYRIPFLLIKPADIHGGTGRQDNRVGSQVDIVATVMGRLGMSYDNHTFGRDLLGDSVPAMACAQFSDWDKVGFVADSLYAIARLDGPSALYRINPASHRLFAQTNLADSLPETAEAYRKYAMAIYTVAYFNIFRPLPHP